MISPRMNLRFRGMSASTDNAQCTVSFAVKNTGERACTEIAQVYATLPEAAILSPPIWPKAHRKASY
jgi:hypothetical protein